MELGENDIRKLRQEMYRYENPPMPEGEKDVETDIYLYKPHDCIVTRWISEEMFVPLVDDLDQDLLTTPPSSEDELSDDDDIEIIDVVIPFKGGAFQEEPVKDSAPFLIQDVEIEDLSDESQTRTIDNKNDGKTALPLPQNTEEIVLYSDDSQTSTKCETCTKNKENKNKVNSISPRRINQQKSSNFEELIKCLRRYSTDLENSRSPSESSYKRKRNYTSHDNSRRSECPKRMFKRSADLPLLDQEYRLHKSRRCYSPQACQPRSPPVRRPRTPQAKWYDSPRESRHRSPRENQHCSPRENRHRSPRESRHHSPRERRHHSPRDRRPRSPHLRQNGSVQVRQHRSPQHASDRNGKTTRDIYSPDNGYKTKTRQIIHYIDNSDQDFELSEIKISSKVVKKTAVPTSQETFQRIPDDPDSPKKADSESEKVDIKSLAFENYYCKDCQITLNSKLTWESHIVGKKHKKAIQCQAIHEIAKGSIRVPQNPGFASMDKPRFANPTAGKKLVLLDEISRLQRVVDEETRYPMPGLDRVIEIRSENVITYYCELCDAPCQPVSIMPHLIGFNHQIVCMKEIDREFYEEAKYVSRKKSIMRKLLAILFNHQDRHRKGKIRVYEETPDPNAMPNPIESLYFDRPGPSWGNVPMKPEHDEHSESGAVSNDEYLDTSKSTFYCKLCDSHMNNMNMWAAHVRGKRHLKNVKKSPGEKPWKRKAGKAPPHVASKLESMLRKEARGEVIVGLDYIRETQSKNGEIYNCFLCCACATNYDIVDHILLTKHQIKYLEKMDTDGNHNGIKDIAGMDIRDVYFRDNLIKGECWRMVEKYGSGKVEVYISKDI